LAVPVRSAPIALLALVLVLHARTAPASDQDQVRVARRALTECLGLGHCDSLDRLYAPGFTAHGASATYTLEQDIAATRSWREAMPDLELTIERTVAARDMVAVHWKAVGTNTVAVGELPGKGDRMGIEGMTFFRFAGGRIIEEWSVLDVAALRKFLD
jgi:predicted ester cyclase